MLGLHQSHFARTAVKSSRRDTKRGFGIGARKGRRPPLKGAPLRSRMLNEAITGWESQSAKFSRARNCALLFGIIGGAIALLATGTSPNSSLGDGYPTVTGLLIAGCLAIAGGVIGYFAGNKRRYPLESQSDKQEEQQ